MDIVSILTLIGGIALFLFGMSVMGDSLKKVAGSKMEVILYKLSGNTLKGVMLGTGVTAVVQSSSAVSVMVVGFVNAGMMKVRQGISVVLGAILGTSITGWILCLNSLGGSGSSVMSLLSTQVLTGIVVLIGIILWMSGAIEPLREDPAFIQFLTSFSNPALGVLAGLIVTAVIQSASASIGILQALAVTGALQFDMAFPILMGIGIGAAVPVMLSALGTSANGKRTAFVYLIIDILGAILVGAIFYILNAIFHFSFMNVSMTMVLIALTNTLYRLAVVLLLAPATGLLEKLVCAIFPEGKEAAEERADMDRLEPRFLATPPLSIEQSHLVINSMAGKALDSVENAVAVRREYCKDGIKRVFDLEEVLDRYEDKLGAYLSKITAADLNEEQSEEVSKYLTVLSDFERMSDHAKNVGEAATEISEKKLQFSEAAERELRLLEDAVLEISALAIDAFLQSDYEEAKKVDPLEEVIDDLCDTVKARHIERVSRQECTLENGFVFNDLLTDYERIADHCSNIAIDLVEEGHALFHEHEYHQKNDYRQDPVYIEYFKTYKQKYGIAD